MEHIETNDEPRHKERIVTVTVLATVWQELTFSILKAKITKGAHFFSHAHVMPFYSLICSFH